MLPGGWLEFLGSLAPAPSAYDDEVERAWRVDGARRAVVLDAVTNASAQCGGAQPVLQRLEAQIAGASGPFFGGSEPGVGDLGLFATIDMILVIAPHALESEAPTLQGWYAAVAALPSAPARMRVLVSAAPDMHDQSMVLGLYRLFVNLVEGSFLRLIYIFLLVCIPSRYVMI